MPANDRKHAIDPDLDHCYLVVKVALDHIRPPIWRRLVVPASITLDLLHDVLQGVMGWEDYHLHQFTIAGCVANTACC